MSTATITETTTEQVDRAVRKAHQAHRASAGETPHTRARWLLAVADALTAHELDLVGLACEETQLLEPRLHGELRRTVFQLALLAEELRSGLPLEATIDHADSDWGMGPRPDIRRVNVPLGVVGVFGASNFPFAFSVIGGDSASALAAGCGVVHKIHPGHPLLARRTAEVVVGALAVAGAPAGLFSVVEGHDAGVDLVEHPTVKAVGFTGSTSGGRALFDRACARPEPIPFFGELGSTNPVFVLPEAWAGRATAILQGYAASFTLGMGQFCTKPGLLVAPADAAGDDLDRVRSVLAESVSRAPLTCLLTPSFREAYAKSLAEVRGLEGVDVVVAGTEGAVPGPSVLSIEADQVLRASDLLEREIFGPATVLIRYRDVGQVTALAELLPGQLTATIHADSDDDSADLVEVLSTKAGRVLWNDWPTGVTVSYAQHHGGPYPATTAPSATSVGTAAIGRFLRPVAYQGIPDEVLPPPLQDGNPWAITRRVDGRLENSAGSGR